MNSLYLFAGLAGVLALLMLLLTHLVKKAKRRETLKKLGLPLNAALTEEQAQALRTFEDTDMKLKKSFPTVSDRQRELIARDILRDKGMLPKKRTAAKRT
jgi:hypothetical protein